MRSGVEPVCRFGASATAQLFYTGEKRLRVLRKCKKRFLAGVICDMSEVVRFTAAAV